MGTPARGDAPALDAQVAALVKRRRLRMRVLAAAIATAVVGNVSGPAAQQPPAVLVFAAASLKTALDELAPAIERSLGVRLRASYAATSALARQIEAGAPADLFIAADNDWMDYVASRGLIQAGTRAPLVGNRLVLVAPRDRPIRLAIGPGFGLAAALGGGRLAMADPVSVPAGKYARAALTTLGVWDSVSTRLAPADHVRVALAFVARGDAPLGVVYHSDAIAEPGVVVVGTFPASTHPAIVYPAALMRTASPAAGRVLAYLRGPAARAVWTKHGFQ